MNKILLTIGTLILMLCAQAQAYAAPINLDKLVPRFGESTGDKTNTDLSGKYNELKVVGDLPEISAEEGVATVIITVLTWSMILALIALLAAGIYYLISRGEEENLAKAKSIVIYLLVGMLVIAGAYGLVSGISQFDFLK